MDLAELEDPLAVWKAVEGDSSDLVDLLRSEKAITRRTREALADFFAGDLKPVRLSKGRPPATARINRSYVLHYIYHGHDITTSIGSAGFYYERLREFIRKKGWHRGRPGWSIRLKGAVAKRRGIEQEQFINYLSRSRPKPFSKRLTRDEYIQIRRAEIALAVRRAKTPNKD